MHSNYFTAVMYVAGTPPQPLVCGPPAALGCNTQRPGASLASPISAPHSHTVQERHTGRSIAHDSDEFLIQFTDSEV